MTTIESTTASSSVIRYSDDPTSERLRAVYLRKWGSCEPAYLRKLSRTMEGLPDRRRVWLVALAGRIQTGGYANLDDVPLDRFFETAQLY